MWTKEQRAAAFGSPQIVRDGDKLYLAVAADFGRQPGEVHMDTLYQRIGKEGDAPRKWWYGTKLAADSKFNAFEARKAELSAHREAIARSTK